MLEGFLCFLQVRDDGRSTEEKFLERKNAFFLLPREAEGVPRTG
mgnify:CR=1 FL=1